MTDDTARRDKTKRGYLCVNIPGGCWSPVAGREADARRASLPLSGDGLLAEAAEALEPFATWAGKLDETIELPGGDKGASWSDGNKAPLCRESASVGDLRRAREVRARLTTKDSST